MVGLLVKPMKKQGCKGFLMSMKNKMLQWFASTGKWERVSGLKLLVETRGVDVG